jgi:type IV pilus assembly protein PilA
LLTIFQPNQQRQLFNPVFSTTQGGSTMLQKLRGNNQKGFTLIELMIVIAIIGILAAIAIPQFAAYRVRGFNSSAQSDIRNLSTSQAAFFSDWQRFGSTQDTDPVVAAVGGALLRGPATALHTIGTLDAGGGARSLNIGIGNLVDIVSHTPTTVGDDTSFTAASKHLNGDTVYGMDSDVSMMYHMPQPSTFIVGEPIIETTAPPSTPADDFFGIGTWVAR